MQIGVSWLLDGKVAKIDQLLFRNSLSKPVTQRGSIHA